LQLSRSSRLIAVTGHFRNILKTEFDYKTCAA
jgi:hypothetical protein